MRAFIDTSAWFAAANAKDRHHQRASELLGDEFEFVTSTFIIVETWLLLQSKISFEIAEGFVDHVRSGAATLEDQTFSLVDRTSFVMMERLAITKVISFDADFLIYRYGADRDRAFEVLR